MQLCGNHNYLFGSAIFSLCGFGNKFVFDIFKDFQGNLITCNHNDVHLKWTTTSLDLNSLGGEYLAFDSSSYSFWATCVNATSEKVQVI